MDGRSTHTITLRRAYDPPAPDDGQRILVDALWPRGVSRAALRIDEWMKLAAPSAALRDWFGHDPAKWDTFRARYCAELDARAGEIAPLLDRCRAGRVTLVFAARDTAHNNAVALREWLLARLAA